MTDTLTLTNEAPMLTEDLVFDLGDTLKCGVLYPGCDREPAWLFDMDCGCVLDVPACSKCKDAAINWIVRMSANPFRVPYRCKYCHAQRVHLVNWRPI